MAWPPTIPPNNRANATPSPDNHPADHNATADALTAIVAQVDALATSAAGAWRRTTGVILSTQPGQAGIGATTVDLTGLSVSFTASATKRYRATYVLSIQFSASTFGRVYLANGANTTLQTAVPSTPAGLYAAVCYVWEAPPGTLSGAVTLKLRADVPTGTASINQGPAGPSLLLVDECT